MSGHRSRSLLDDPAEVARVVRGSVDVILAESAWLDVARRARPPDWSDALSRIRRIREASALLLRYLPALEAHNQGTWSDARPTADELLDRLGRVDPPDPDYQSAGR